MIEDSLRDLLSNTETVVPDRLVDDAIRDGVRRRQRVRQLMSIPIVVVLAAVVAATVALRTQGDTPRVNGHPTPPSFVKPSPGTIPTRPAATTPPSSPPTTVVPADVLARVWPIGNVNAAIADGQTIDAIVRPDPASRVSTVLRIDPATGRTLARSEQFDGGFALVRAGSWLWVSDWPLAPRGGHVGELVQLDPVTLNVHRRVTLAEQWQPTLTGNAHLLWAGTTTHLYRIDPDRGTVVRTVTLEGQDTGPVSDVALDPQGRWLWDTETNVGSDPQNPQKPNAPLVLTRRDPNSGAVQNERRDLPSVAGGTVLPASDGVWIAASGGHFMFVTRLNAETLVKDATWANPAEGGFVGPNGATVSVIGNRIWVLNPGLSTTIATTVACADAKTGTVLATRQFARVQDGSIIAVVDNQLAIAATAGLAVSDVPAPCRSN